MDKAVIIYAMVYGGSALMVWNIVRYTMFEKFVAQTDSLGEKKWILMVPRVLLIMFLIGYLLIGIIGKPDMLVSGILFGGSVFVFLILRIMWTILHKVRDHDQLQAGLRSAEKASAAKSVFLSNMSHDIRTPMNAIIGYTRLARREGTTLPEAQGYLEKIENSSQHLLSLISDILEMSRIESGKMELEEIPTDLKAVTREVYDLFETQMQEKQLQYTVQLEAEDTAVLCDRNRLNRIMLNLISNACKFTPEGGEVSVLLRQTGNHLDEKTIYELRVRDTGIGMAPEFAARVFEAFERERTTTVSGTEGTGLGMAITKNFVDLMDGTITVESAPGKGTTFIVRLPFCVWEGELPNKKEMPLCPKEEHGDDRQRRFLLAEDVAVNREIATALLTDRGCLVEGAENGKEAVEKFKAAKKGYYDAILMDIQMPVMDGYEASRMIRKLEAEFPEKGHIPIIAVTANAFSEDIRKAEEAGMDGHIAKPIDPNVMMETLAGILCRK